MSYIGASMEFLPQFRMAEVLLTLQTPFFLLVLLGTKPTGASRGSNEKKKMKRYNNDRSQRKMREARVVAGARLDP